MMSERQRVAAAFAAKVQRSASPGVTVRVTGSMPKPEAVGGKKIVGLPANAMPRRVGAAERAQRVAAAKLSLSAFGPGHFARRKRELRDALVAVARKALR